MILKNIEFYNTPSGDVIIAEVNQPIRVLVEEETELIDSLLQTISDADFPDDFNNMDLHLIR